MLNEIREQPAALEKTLRRELSGIRKLKAHIEKAPPRFIVLAARGTSDNAAQFGRYLIEILTGIPVSLAAPSVYTVYGANVSLKDALVVAISQSGESTDTNFVLEQARKQGALTVGITNEADSTLAKLADYPILVRAGKEKSVAATKTYTGQLLAMYLLAHALGGKITPTQLEKLPEYASKALKAESEVAQLASRYQFMERGLVVGRGVNYSNSFEMALKLMETCYVVAERFSSADLLHGPIAMVHEGFPAFMFAPHGDIWKSLSETLERLRSLKAETLLITDRKNKAAVDHASRKIVLPLSLDELWTPIPYVIPAQLFAAHLASEKGLNPDQPRALTKVTRTL